MIRTNILIVDEFVRTEKEVITRVFDPMLSDPRKPMYLDLTKEQKAEEYKHEELRKVYLSSIRRADEWSYKTFEDYVNWMTDGNRDYCTNVVSYVLGVKNGFISKKKVEDTFKSNLENMSILRAEYLAIPERGTGNSYFTYKMMDRARTNSKALLLIKLVLLQILARFTTIQQLLVQLLGRLILFIRKWFLSMIWHLVLV